MKTVIELAKQAGWEYVDDDRGFEPLWRFAELVRADAIADEREACALLCEKKPAIRTTLGGPSIGETVGKRLAASIRARGEPR